jgi:hypothetical protein
VTAGQGSPNRPVLSSAPRRLRGLRRVVAIGLLHFVSSTVTAAIVSVNLNGHLVSLGAFIRRKLCGTCRPQPLGADRSIVPVAHSIKVNPQKALLWTSDGSAL